MKTRIVALLLVAGLMAGCGLAETAATGATAGAGAAEQAKQGRKLEEKVKADVDNMQQQAAEARDAAEAAAAGGTE